MQLKEGLKDQMRLIEDLEGLGDDFIPDEPKEKGLKRQRSSLVETTGRSTSGDHPESAPPTQVCSHAIFFELILAGKS